MLGNGKDNSGDFRQCALDVYLLPTTPWEETVALQQRLVYELSAEPRNRAALILCEHYPVITVGRLGSRRHILADEDDLRSQRISVQWTNRGGGCWMHAPGQLAAYPLVPLNASTMSLSRFRDSLYRTLDCVLEELKLPATRDRRNTGLCIGGREVAAVGVAVKQWITYHGCCLNVCTPPDRFDAVQTNPNVKRPVTSIFRELRAPIRLNAVRESFLRHFVDVFGFGKYYLCNPPNVVTSKAGRLNVATGNH